MKQLLSLLLLVSFGAIAHAQIDDSVVFEPKQHLFYAGVKGGVGFSTMTQPDECDLYDSMGLGYHGGLVLHARFNRANRNTPAGTGLLGVGLEARYQFNSVKTIATDETGKEKATLDLTYIDVPVYAHIYPFYKTTSMNNFYVEVGPDFAFLMGRKPQVLTYKYPGGGTVAYNIDNGNSKLKGMDIRMMAGLGYDFAIKNNDLEATSLIGINARYYMGMNKLAGNFNSKMSSVEISLSWLFNIAKL